jgi:hypothetical protein
MVLLQITAGSRDARNRTRLGVQRPIEKAEAATGVPAVPGYRLLVHPRSRSSPSGFTLMACFYADPAREGV